MFSAGIAPGGTGLGTLVPLVETTVETISSGMLNAVSSACSPVAPNTQRIVAVHGVSSTVYTGLKKGTAPYANGQAQSAAARLIALQQGRAYRVECVTAIHGESDHLAGTTQAQYAADMIEWQHDYETDAKALSGQTQGVPLLHSQMSSHTVYNAATSVIPQAQLDASDGIKVVLVGPKYQIPYNASIAHLTNVGYRWLGELHGKVLGRLNAVGSWTPLQPASVSRAGAVITITFSVPVAPLVFDDVLVTDPGSYGFEYTDDSSPPAISSVVLVGTTQVRVTLASTPTGANKRIRYAYTGTPLADAGPLHGARGCLRDNDPTVGRSGSLLYNWCVHFDMAVA
jgi:hypothetical protein